MAGDIAAQNKRNRNAGRRWETEIMRGARQLGLDYERTRDTGSRDEGDGVIRYKGNYIVVEAKNAKLEPTGFLNEAKLEAKHFAEHRQLDGNRVHPAVFVKRRGKGFEEGMVLMTVDSFHSLLEAVSGGSNG